MTPPSCLSDAGAELAADASVVINLSATGRYETIVDALPNRLVVVDVVEQELEFGRSVGRTDAIALDDLKGAGQVTIVSLDGSAQETFRTLVEGSAVETLDDGEAATISYAAGYSATALIDERKANRICEQQFPDVYRGATVDIVAHPAVIDALGPAGHQEAVFNALYYGKMRVLPHHQEWIVDVVGPDRISHCKSLPRHLRTDL